MMFVGRSLARAKARASSNARFASCLVIAEHNNQAINNSTLSAISAAKAIGGPVHVLVAGKDAKDAASSAAKAAGVDKVFLADGASVDNGVAEGITALISGLQAKNKYSHIIASASNYGRNIAPRVAVKLDVAPVSDVIKVHDESTFDRPTYAGNAIAKVKSNDAVKVITVRPTAFEKVAATGSNAPVEAVEVPASPIDVRVLGEEKTKSERPELTSAAVVVSGGRALKSADNFKILYELADKLGGAVGASRAAVDAGFAPNDLQVGQTGKVVAPQLYVAAGISGAIQHLAGMKDSKTIVAINKDSEAPIFQVADYGLVADLFNAVPELTSKVPVK